jgi:hypothetical protein
MPYNNRAVIRRRQLGAIGGAGAGLAYLARVGSNALARYRANAVLGSNPYPITGSNPRRRIGSNPNPQPAKRRKLMPMTKITTQLGHGKVGRSRRKKVKKPVRTTTGMRKSFVTKVMKVMQAEDPYMIWRSVRASRLAQVTTDKYTWSNSDENGVGYDFFSPREFWDKISMLGNSKAISPNSASAAGNYVANLKVHVIQSYAKFFFKSTSSHVVNVEMYIGHYKQRSEGNTRDLRDWITQCEDDVTRLGYTGGAVSAGWTLIRQGTDVNLLPGLTKKWRVEKRTFKVNPGHYHVEYIQGPKNRIYEGSTMVKDGLSGEDTSANQFDRYYPGSVNVCFRVINDATVSGGTTGGQIHNWPSNEKGGVAMSCETTYKFNGDNVGATRNTVAVADFRSTFTGDAQQDQQVVVQNPASSASTAI